MSADQACDINNHENIAPESTNLSCNPSIANESVDIIPLINDPVLIDAVRIQEILALRNQNKT